MSTTLSQDCFVERMQVPRVRRRAGSARVGTLRYQHAAGVWLWFVGTWAEWFDQSEAWALWELHQGEACDGIEGGIPDA